jgi:transposase
MPASISGCLPAHATLRGSESDILPTCVAGRRCCIKIELDIARSVGIIIITYGSPPKPDPKRTALEASGTLNPHAQDVQDPTFIDSDFFDPRDLVQVRYEMLRRVHIEGQAITDATSGFGVSRPTFYKAQSDFERRGLEGLLPTKRGPHGPHKITNEVMRFIQTAREAPEPPDALTLVKRIAERFGLRVHRRTVERALALSKKKRL